MSYKTRCVCCDILFTQSVPYVEEKDQVCIECSNIIEATILDQVYNEEEFFWNQLESKEFTND